MYSPAVGPCSAARSTACSAAMILQFKVLSLAGRRDRGRYAKATQYTFIVSTKPTSNAGQLSAATHLGAAINRAIDEAILTISHAMNPTAAVPAFKEEKRPVRPLSLIHISEPTRRTPISYAVFC